MLVLGELAGDESCAPGRRLPVDAMQRIAGLIGTQLVQLRARSARAPRHRTLFRARRAPRGAAREVRSDIQRRVLRDLPRPPRESEQAQHACADRRPLARAEAPGKERQLRFGALMSAYPQEMRALRCDDATRALHGKFGRERQTLRILQHDARRHAAAQVGAPGNLDPQRKAARACQETLERKSHQDQRGRNAPQQAERLVLAPQTHDRQQDRERHERQRASGEAHFGTGVCSRICAITPVPVALSSAASGVSSNRCASTAGASSFTSSGVTNSAPRSAAAMRAPRSSASAPRVDSSEGHLRVLARGAREIEHVADERLGHVHRARIRARLLDQRALERIAPPQRVRGPWRGRRSACRISVSASRCG